MEKLVMRRCCCKCGWSVHKCAVINALASMVFSVLVFTACIYDISVTGPERNSVLAKVMKYDPNDPFADVRIITLSYQVNYVFLVNSVFSFAFGLASLYGILMRKKYYVLPWLIYNGVSLIGLIFTVVIFSVIFPLALVLVLIMPLYGYMYIIGHSFYFRLAAAEARARDPDLADRG